VKQQEEGTGNRTKVVLGWTLAAPIVFVLLWVMIDGPQNPSIPKPVPPGERRNVRSCEELDDERPFSPGGARRQGAYYDPPVGAEPPERNVPPW
jgi:hypothetical protein